MTTYKLCEVADNGSVEQCLGEFDFADLPDMVKTAVARNVSADRWDIPDLSLVVTRVVRHDTYLRFRCQAFQKEGVRNNRVAVQPDGAVLVWDSAGNQYTRCHALSEETQRKIRSKANKVSVASAV